MATKKELEAAKLIDEYLEARLSGKPVDRDACLRRCPPEMQADICLALDGADFLILNYEPLLRKGRGAEAARSRIQELSTRGERVAAMEQRMQRERDLGQIPSSAVLAFLGRIMGVRIPRAGATPKAASWAPIVLYRGRSEEGAVRAAAATLRSHALVEQAERTAQQFLDEAGDPEVPIDPYKVARAHGVLVIERVAEGCDGCILIEGDAAAILVNSSVATVERRRFTVAHELGHFALHRDVLQFRRESLNEIEQETDSGLDAEANAFGSALLMPTVSVDRGFSRREPTLYVADEMREHYLVSSTAAALRLTKRSHYAGALVLAKDGRIVWVARSPEWRRYFVPTGVPLHGDTLAAAVLEEGKDALGPLPVAARHWAPDHRQGEDAELIEQARVIYHDTVLCMLYDKDASA
jgi:Zn-dependent peptidase ImmA (M78 family)